MTCEHERLFGRCLSARCKIELDREVPACASGGDGVPEVPPAEPVQIEKGPPGSQRRWQHGSTTGYRSGCRCEACKEAFSAYRSAWWKSRPEQQAKSRAQVRRFRERWGGKTKPKVA